MTKRSTVSLKKQLLAATIILSSLVGCAKRDSSASYDSVAIVPKVNGASTGIRLGSYPKTRETKSIGELATQASLLHKATFTTNYVVVDENPQKNDAEIRKRQKAVRRLDVVFLIDGTSSMRKPIDEVKKGVEQIANTLKSLKAEESVDVQFGLVVYRDVYRDREKTQCDDNMYEFNNLGDLKEFVDKLGKVEAIGGGDVKERGYVAIQDAIVQTSWRESSTRNLIVVGDAQWHEDGESNPMKIGNDEIADLANENRVSIDVIAVRSERLANQLSSLARRTGGETLLFNEVDKDKLAQEISKKLGARAEEIKLNGDVLDGLVEGKDMETISKETGKSPEEIGKVLRALQELERFKTNLEADEAIIVP